MEYNPKHFKIDSEEECLKAARAISFASIIYLNNGRLEASHNPLLVDVENRKVWGHFAKANFASKSTEDQDVLITFQGEHGLIKPEWYGTENNVPTWNYVAIHLRGKIRTFTDHSALKEMLKAMSSLYSIDNLELPEKLLNGIVGFCIVIDEIHGKAKLGQTKSTEATLNVIEQLNNNGNTELASLMKSAMNSQDKN